MCHRLSLVFFLALYTGCLRSQETISVDAVSPMPVCGSKMPADQPCAGPPKPLSKINPAYPEKARQQRKQGTVTLGVTVTKDGSVSGVRVINGVDKDIDKAAIDAVTRSSIPRHTKASRWKLRSWLRSTFG